MFAFSSFICCSAVHCIFFTFMIQSNSIYKCLFIINFTSIKSLKRGCLCQKKKKKSLLFWHMSRGCIICLWSSTWAGHSKTRWSTWGYRMPAMKPSTRSDTQEVEAPNTTHILWLWYFWWPFYFFIKCHYVALCCSLASTWRSWRTWRRMQGWGMEAWADWQVKSCRCLTLNKTGRKRG